MLRIKNKAAAQASFDEDYNVSDVKPDIGRLVQSKADVSMEEVRLSEGRALLKGTLNADLLYVGEKEGRIYSLSAKLPLDEMINLEGIEGGDKLCLKWEIEDLSVHMIHSRKLNIKAIVTFYAVVDELAVVELPVSAEDQEGSVKTEKVRLMSLRVHKKDTLRIKDDITLASNRPNVEYLLWKGCIQHAVLEHGTNRSGSALRKQGKFGFLCLDRVHFLLYHVCGFADRPQEQVGAFKGWNPHFMEAETLCGVPCNLFHGIPFGNILWCNVFRPLRTCDFECHR